MQKPFNRIWELDGIRGIAIAMVVVYHDFFLTTVFKMGSVGAYLQLLCRLTWTGVDLFFVLSGFLIGGILLDSVESQNYFRTFYTRRFFRIVPLYAAFLVCIYLFVQHASPRTIATFGTGLDDRRAFYPYVLFLQNIWMAGGNYITFMGVTWSLAVEEQFYLIMPFLVRVFRKRRLLWLITGGICAAPIARIFISYLWQNHPLAIYVLMPCRMDALLFGVLGAYAVRKDLWRKWLEAHPQWLQAIGAILLAGMIVLIKYRITLFDGLMASAGYTWIASFYLCALLYAVTQPRSRFSACLRWKPLCWLGSIAYGVYLAHSYAMNFFYTLFFSRPLYLLTTVEEYMVVAASIVTTLVVCRFSWLYFEKPLVQFGHQFNYEASLPVLQGSDARWGAMPEGFQPVRVTRPYVRPMVRRIPAESFAT